MLRGLLGDSKLKPKKAEAPAQPKSAPAVPVIDTVLGTGACFEGNLKTEGNVRVHGTFVGDITAHGKVAVGEHGKLEGDLIGEAVDVGGQVRGNILARKVAVMSSGRIWGDLRLEKLLTEEGAFIQGVVTMEDKVDLPGKPEPSKTPDENEVSSSKIQAKEKSAPKADPKNASEPKLEIKKETASKNAPD
ncbi:MAG: polymer-forming cytoskeletal protein [Anaerolineae bacterium]|nr:polymer-forming cytoskeletal protein [Anaerolineae bacterium]